MTGFLAHRAVWGLVTLLLFVTAVFFLVQLLIPYDYSINFRLAGTHDLVRAELGLDRPLPARYLDYMTDLARGDLGLTYGGTPVTEVIAGALPLTVLIFASGGILAFMLGEWLGRLVAWHRSRLVAGSVSTAAVIFYTAFPPWLVFVLAYFLTEPLYGARRVVGLPSDSLTIWRSNRVTERHALTVLAVSLLIGLVSGLVVRTVARLLRHRWVAILALPACLAGVVGGLSVLGAGSELLDVLFRAARSASVGRGSPVLAIPAFVLLAFGEVMFVVRTAMAGERGEDYVRTARAKGVADRQVRDRHVARNSMLPALSRLFTGLPYILTGLIIIERELQVGGLSTVLFAAVQEVDVPLIVGLLVTLGVGLVVRLVLDVLHAALDPRIRVEAA